MYFGSVNFSSSLGKVYFIPATSFSIFMVLKILQMVKTSDWVLFWTFKTGT